MSQNHTTPSAPYRSVKVINDSQTVAAEWCETAMSTVSRIWSTPVGLGATTQGCRPISVNTQPALFARNGVGMARMESHANQRLPGIRPRRVTHSPASANSADPAASPIIARKDQYVTNRLGR
ncbi:Uncharacterised protein [Mycobacteroides abscessus subsp. abscessus]|nr:Uncharacterised protein [Mycobacteroides abscessus subsp. abscessus]